MTHRHLSFLLFTAILSGVPKKLSVGQQRDLNETCYCNNCWILSVFVIQIVVPNLVLTPIVEMLPHFASMQCTLYSLGGC